MHHTIGWRASAADATLQDITPVPDSLMLIQNSHFVPQYNYNLLYAYVGGASINRARFVTPSFRQKTTPWIRPIQPSIVPVDEPNIADYRGNPLVFRALEEIELDIMQTSGGALVVMAAAGISKTPNIPAPMGDVFVMRGTGTTTAVAGGWTLAPITWQDTLPAGKYACVGLEAIGVTMVSARLVFEDQWERPGTIAQSLATGNGNPMFRGGGLGVWGRFDANRMPNVEILCNAADTAQEIYLFFTAIG